MTDAIFCKPPHSRILSWFLKGDKKIDWIDEIIFLGKLSHGIQSFITSNRDDIFVYPFKQSTVFCFLEIEKKQKHYNIIIDKKK